MLLTWIWFYGLSECFDITGHKMLFQIVQVIGFCNHTIDWFKSYLNNIAISQVCLACNCNSTQFWNGLDSLPVGGYSPSIGGYGLCDHQ